MEKVENNDLDTSKTTFNDIKPSYLFKGKSNEYKKITTPSATNDNDDDKIFHITQSRLYINLSRLFHSQNCIYFYIFMIFLSVLTLIYSIVALIAQLDELPIIIFEVILIIAITIDMSIRIYLNKCENFFKKLINVFDFILILFSFVTVFIYVMHYNTIQQVEDLTFAFIIFLRNLSQLVRLYLLIKSQHIVQKNVQEIIDLNSIYEEKKLESLQMQNIKYENNKYSFFEDEEDKKPKISKISNTNYDFKE